MNKEKRDNKFYIKISVAVVFLLCGIYCAKLFQPQSTSTRLYKQALIDYQKENYSNSYFLFSKIGIFSQLKPYAIYRQALCAKALGDEKSEIERFSTLFKFFPTNKLSTEAKYETAQYYMNRNQSRAKRYFTSIAKYSQDDNYKLASEYYLAKLEANDFENRDVDKIQEVYRKYLKSVPDGRLAVNVAQNWLQINPNPSVEDMILIIKAYYLAGGYEKVQDLASTLTLKDNWVYMALSSFKLNQIPQAKAYTQSGISKYSQSTDIEYYKKAIDNYLETDKDSINYLLETAQGKGKDYILNLKCSQISGKDKQNCYENLVKNYPDSEYVEDAIASIFLAKISNEEYLSAKHIADSFLSKYPQSSYIPMFLFWDGKIKQKYSSNSEFIQNYKNIIDNYPDSYYAYRAFWILKGIGSATTKLHLDYKPVEYPYKYPLKGDIMNTFILVGDYDMMAKLSEDDFIKSWGEYKKGNYAASVHLAKLSMDKLEEKPPKTDLRWRLVYPQNFYKQVVGNTSIYGNDPALIMAIIKEESHFNTYSESGVGAIGLMQIMPSTAHEVGEKNGLNFYTKDLFNPELNIKIGNIYYSELLKSLNNSDISAIAAYNGGIGSVSRWKSSLKYNDIDEFVEQIPYPETKNYVKKVFRSYWNYLRIYQKI